MFDKIIDNLYLGDAGDYDKQQFALIVNCCPEINVNYSDGANVLWIKVYDDRDDNEKMVSQIFATQVLEKIHHHRMLGLPVLVHCAMGIQRSATIIACYLLRHTTPKKTVAETIQYICSKREIAFSTGYTFLPVMAFYSLLL